jgi:two-component system OmpR family response regulator
MSPAAPAEAAGAGRRQEASARILVVEDDETTAQEIARELAGRGFTVDRSSHGDEALAIASRGEHHVITLDRLIPGLDGLAIAAALKARGVATPILMISALGDVDERVRGLRAGGDDYLTKPFALAEMAARVEVLLRRARAEAERGVLRYADLELELQGRRARRGGETLRLFPKEAALLEFFLRHPEQTLTRAMIFEQVWGYSFDPGTNLIDVHVRALRLKIEGAGRPPLLQTVRGLGYRLSVHP